MTRKQKKLGGGGGGGGGGVGGGGGGGGGGEGEREINLPKIDTIHVIITEAALLFCTPSPSMLILKNFLITLQPRTQGFTLERGRGGPSKGKGWGLGYLEPRSHSG